MAGEVVKSCITCADGKACEVTSSCLPGNTLQYRHWKPRGDSGANGTYYEVDIKHSKSGRPYRAECQDIIEALGMDFNEGNAFKAIWRRCAARSLGKVKKGNEDPLYDAQKIAFYSGRILAKEEQKK